MKKIKVVMKITRKITFIIFVLTILVTLFTGCGITSVNSSNVINHIAYDNFDFWEQENQVRITLPIKERTVEKNEEIKGIGQIKLSKNYLDRVERLKDAIILYFKEIYNVDISERISRQQVRAFDAYKTNLGKVMGYVDPSEPDVLNLNKELLSNYADFFDNFYVRESLHQLGFISKKESILTEGIVDALTDLILRRANIKSVLIDDYYEPRALAYQILAVDIEIAEYYLNNNNPSIADRISLALNPVKKPFKDVSNLGNRLENLINGLINGIRDAVSPHYLAFEAQEIVRAYCQSFNPSRETIQYIRRYYLVEEYERIYITYDGNAYLFQYE